MKRLPKLNLSLKIASSTLTPVRTGSRNGLYQRGNTLIGLLLSVVIIAILSVVFLKGGFFGPGHSAVSRKDKLGTTIPGAVKLKAQDTVCQSDLQQVRDAIELASSSDADGKFPASLSELKLPSELLHCPIGHEAYVYDPATGQVHCPHPGHEKY